LKTNGSATPGLPYEFKALEAALTSVVAALENDLANIRSHVVELLNVMENHIGASLSLSFVLLKLVVPKRLLSDKKGRVEQIGII